MCTAICEWMTTAVQQYCDTVSVVGVVAGCCGKAAFSKSGTRWYFDHKSPTAHATLSGIYTVSKHKKNSHIHQPPLMGYELSP